MMRYFGNWGGLFNNGLYWAWQPAEGRGYWIRPTGTVYGESGFSLHDMYVKYSGIEELVIPPWVDPDLEVMEGL